MNALPQTPVALEADTDSNLVPPAFTKASHLAYRGKLRLVASIHAEIAPRLNAVRQAHYEVFFREEDKWVPENETPGELRELLLTGLYQSEQAGPA
jgi:hypothetical protein